MIGRETFGWGSAVAIALVMFGPMHPVAAAQPETVFAADSLAGPAALPLNSQRRPGNWERPRTIAVAVRAAY